MNVNKNAQLQSKFKKEGVNKNLQNQNYNSTEQVKNNYHILDYVKKFRKWWVELDFKPSIQIHLIINVMLYNL